MESLSNEMNLTQMIRDPTRVTQDSATLIDHIYVSDSFILTVAVLMLE